MFESVNNMIGLTVSIAAFLGDYGRGCYYTTEKC